MIRNYDKFKNLCIILSLILQFSFSSLCDQSNYNYLGLGGKIVMQKNNLIITGLFLSSLLVISIIFMSYSEHRAHELMHILTLYATLFLAFLSFRAFYNYRLSRLLFSAFAFLLFGVSELIELFDDFEHHDDPLSVNEIRDYIIIGAIALFAVGTTFRIKK